MTWDLFLVCVLTVVVVVFVLYAGWRWAAYISKPWDEGTR